MGYEKAEDYTDAHGGGIYAQAVDYELYDKDINCISINVYPHNDTRQDGVPYMAVITDYFFAHFYMGYNLDPEQAITITWVLKREGAWTGASTTLTSQIGQASSNGSTAINFTSIENAATSFAASGNQYVGDVTRTISASTVSFDKLIAMKLIHNDTDANAITCLDCQVKYYVKRA